MYFSVNNEGDRNRENHLLMYHSLFTTLRAYQSTYTYKIQHMPSGHVWQSAMAYL